MRLSLFYVQGRSWGLQPGNDLDVRLTLGGRMGIRQSFGTRDFTWRGIYFYKGRMLDALSFRMKRRLAGEFPSSVNGKKCCSVQLFLREHRLHLLEISALSDCLRRMQQKSCWKRTPGITASCGFDRCSHADFADTVAGNLFSPIEIPAGIAVSLVGVPYFVYLMWKE